MAKRVTKSLIDPLILPLVPGLYRALAIHPKFPPEGIVALGHIVAIGGAVGFAFSANTWWGGLLAAVGVVGNHVCDMVDGTHARTTGQCRNGGELLDHFTDPLSFSYWMIGIAVSCARLDLALAAVLCIYATAVLTNIKAKLVGEFTLARFGPTEFKALLAVYGLAMAGIVAWAPPASPEVVALWSLAILVVIGIGQLLLNLVRAVIEVNRHGGEPDTTPWELDDSLSQPDQQPRE